MTSAPSSAIVSGQHQGDKLGKVRFQIRASEGCQQAKAALLDLSRLTMLGGHGVNHTTHTTEPQIPLICGIHHTTTSPTLVDGSKVSARVRALAVTNPRQQRALLALLAGPVSREQLDRITGASNSPNVIHRLRCKGFEIPCSSTEATDRDGRPCHPGAYSLTDADRARALALLADWREVQP